jgi:hypothetical protein
MSAEIDLEEGFVVSDVSPLTSNGGFSINRSNPQQAKSPAFLDVDAPIA